MKRLHVIYNPYRVCTTVRFLEGENWVPVDSSSRLSWVRDKRIQRWLTPDDRSSWRGFFAEALDVSGARVLEISFTGTKEDFEDLRAAAEEFRAAGTQILVRPFVIREDAWEDSDAKLEILREKIRSGRKNEVWKLLPEKVRNLLEDVLDREAGRDIRLSLQGSDTETLLRHVNRFERGAVILVFSGAARLPQDEKEKLKRIAEAIRGLGNSELHDERYFFLCETEGDKRSVEGAMRMAFLECGLNTNNLYVLREDEQALLLAGLERYRLRFADQVRLGGLCEEVVKAACDGGIMDKDFRGRIGVVFAGETYALSEDGASDGFNYLDRLREQLDSWDGAERLRELCTALIYGLSGQKLPKAAELLGKDSDADGIGVDEALVCWSKIRNQLQLILREACRSALERIEKQWVGVYADFAGAYLNDDPAPLREIPEIIEADSGVPPLARSGMARLETELAALAGQGKLTAEEACALSWRRAQESFREWLEDYASALLEQLEKICRRVAAGLEGEGKTGYRTQLRSEADARGEADRWLKGFIDSINHLLDIEAEVREDG